MRWTPLVGIAAILAASAVLGVRGSPQAQPSATPEPGRPRVEAAPPEAPSPTARPTAANPGRDSRFEIRDSAPAAAADPKDAAREGQGKLASRMATELSLDSSARPRFIADYMDFADAALQIDLKTQTLQTAEAVIQSRQAEFEARASAYLSDVQMQRLRELLRGQ